MNWETRDPDHPLITPDLDRDYLTLTGLGLLVLTFASMVGLALPLFRYP